MYYFIHIKVNKRKYFFLLNISLFFPFKSFMDSATKLDLGKRVIVFHSLLFPDKILVQKTWKLTLKSIYLN